MIGNGAGRNRALVNPHLAGEGIRSRENQRTQLQLGQREPTANRTGNAESVTDDGNGAVGGQGHRAVAEVQILRAREGKVPVPSLGVVVRIDDGTDRGARGTALQNSLQDALR